MPTVVQFSPDDTLGAAVRRLGKVLSEADFETPDIDARFLLQGVLQIDAADLMKNADRQLGAAAVLLEKATARRLAHEPVSRILGKRDFYGREFKVTPDVLDPRPDTEALINTVLEIADAKGWRERALRLVDIGTGSGAILVTLLAELPLAHGIGTDVSLSALDVARQNAERHGVAARVEFIHGRGLANATAPLDLIVANPPYIPAGEIAGLAPDVREFDPHLALDGGPDGLQIYREIALDISGIKGPLSAVFEVGAGQAGLVSAVMANDPRCRLLPGLKSVRDLGGHVRCVATEIQ